MDENAGIFEYLKFLERSAATLQGQAVLCAGLLVICIVLFTQRGKWLGFSALLFFGIASLFQNTKTNAGYDVVDMSRFTMALIGTARPIFCVLLATMSLKAIAEKTGWRRIRLGTSVWFLLALQLLFALRMLSTDQPVRAVPSALMAILLVTGVYGLLARTLQNLSDVKTIQKFVLLAGLLFVAICIAEYIRNPATVLTHQRFTGISGNPQFAAIFLAVQCLTCVSILLSSDEKKGIRLFIIIALGVFLALLIWTGSRTGALMTVVGVVVLIRSQLTKWIVFGIVLTIALGVGIWLFPDSLNTAFRLVDPTNTRAESYSVAWYTFLDNPLFGDPTIGVVESSYLTVAASMGIFGGCILAVVIFAQIRDIFRTMHVAKQFPEVRNTVDYVLVLSFALAAGAFFEGFLLGYATASIVFVYITLGLTRFVLDYGQQQFSLENPSNPHSITSPVLHQLEWSVIPS